MADIEIWTIEDLDNIRNNLSGDYILMRDLDFNDDDSYSNPSNKSTYTTGAGWVRIGISLESFNGVLNGNNHTIKNLFINSSSSYSGLFGRISSGTIKNLILSSCNVTTTSDYCGSLAGIIGAGATIINCFSDGTVTGQNEVGGLIGEVSVGTDVVSRCGFNGNVTGYSLVGGFVGLNLSSVIQNCWSKGTSSGNFMVGGFVGRAESQIRYSYSESDVYILGTVEGNAGGFAGLCQNAISINNCYSTGNVTRPVGNTFTNFGGFTSLNYRTDIINCYSLGSVYYEGTTDPTNKGFASEFDDWGGYKVMEGNFWDTDVSNQTSTGGVAEGKSTLELQTLSTFTSNNWNIILSELHDGKEDTAIWGLDAGNDYPKLWFEFPIKENLNSYANIIANPIYVFLYEKVENGLILHSPTFNRHLSSTLLKRQPVMYNVSIGDLVTYDNIKNQWIVSASSYPLGIYMGKGIIVLAGYVYGLSGLIPTFQYWMTENGKLTFNRDESFNNTYIGKAISSSEMLINISIYGEWATNE